MLSRQTFYLKPCASLTCKGSEFLRKLISHQFLHFFLGFLSVRASEFPKMLVFEGRELSEKGQNQQQTQRQYSVTSVS